MAAEDYKKPREYASVLIEAFHKGMKNNASAGLSNLLLASAQKEFDSWLRSWHYGMGNKDLKIKVLFIKLLRTSIDKSSRELTLNAATAITLTKPELSELDHLEPKDPDSSFASAAYFQAPQGKTRDEIVDGLGNFMLLDDYDNIKKSNCPLSNAVKFYDVMLNGSTHWLIEEIKSDIANSALFKSAKGYKVPKEDFFIGRRSRLIGYFKALVSSPTIDNDKVNY